MADIELVIRISEEDYKIMKHNIAVNNPLCPLSQEEMVSKVANSVPLSKVQTDMLTKIRTDIELLTYYWCEVNPKSVIDDVLEIIDKYKTKNNAEEMTYEEAKNYLLHCVDEAKSKDWASGIKFALATIEATTESNP